MARIAILAVVAVCCFACGNGKSGVTYDTCDQPAASVAYSIDDPGWAIDGGWEFIFRYTVPTGYYSSWTIQLDFSEKVTSITPYNAIVKGSYNDGYTWLLQPQWWNEVIDNYEESGTAMADTVAGSAVSATASIYNDGGSCVNGGGSSSSSTSTTTTTTTTTTPSNEVSTSPGQTTTTTESPINLNGPTGVLPPYSTQDTIEFSTGYTSGDDPFDYNELLYKSILFYQAQRSGPLDSSTNLVPWRGDSGLHDGCMNGYCGVDLRGGWYDAGDFVKFGFPMAFSTTVLAWGMVDFKAGYVNANQWDHALDMLKWATDYFLKAHTAPNELYFQVGDGDTDHAYWGHPETMTMARPVYKVDAQHPGSEVAAETAAALAASYLAFKTEDALYANSLLQNAIELYDFADTYRGNYGDSVPESNVNNYYKSWSGYNDELMWGAMWLYRATGDDSYLSKAEQFVDSVGMSEFSWDSKGPGAMVLLSEYQSQYKANVDSALQTVMNMPTTPGGLTFFSQWGTNRYAANYALIALMTANMDGIESSTGSQYYNYGKNQIFKLLGQGDQSRSYVVGFGSNSPQRPHHRSSSCRAWNPDPSSQVCDYSDESNSGPNPQILYGALVGGPGQDGSYNDDRGDYVKNEVACDYNAGYQSAVAGLKYFQSL